MNLEDHLGDIIRKARTMSNVAASDAARTAGLTAAELAALEETGQMAKKADLGALAQLVGLQPFKLEGIAQGWLPTQPDLSVWRELRCIGTTASGTAVNCYLIWDEVTREAAVFD